MSYSISPDGIEATGIHVLEQKKFFETTDGQVAVRIGGAGTLIDGVIFDAIGATIPNATTRIYNYFRGGLGGTQVAQVTVTYTDSSRSDLLTAVRTG